MSAAHPLLPSQLLDYALGELSEAAADLLEAHLFDCAGCGARAAGVEALVRGTAALLRAGALGVLATETLVERLERDGLRVRRYDVPPGGTVACGATPHDDVVVLRLRSPPVPPEQRGALTAEWVGPDGTLFRREDEAPHDGEALYLTSPAPWVRAMPPNRSTVRLLADGEPLCEWILDHQGALP